MPFRRPWLLLLLGTLLLGGWSLALFFPDRRLLWDWEYFSAFSLVTRSSWLSYHLFPTHNPWVSGGLDFLANPQTRVFSPLAIFDLLFAPPLSLLLSLALEGVVGALGAYCFAVDRGAKPASAAVAAFAFIHCSWFGQHLGVGHVAFGNLQLLPWLAFCAQRIAEPRRFWGLCALLAFFAVDGGMYAVIFSAVFLIAFTLAGFCRPFSVLRAGQTSHYSFMLISALAVAGAKFIPLLAMFGSRLPPPELAHLKFSQLGWALFNPFVGPMEWRGTLYLSHEYVSYIPLAALVAVGWRIRSLSWRLLAVGLFFFWIASGIGDSFNPWTLFTRLPLVGNSHVQSRYFILWMLCFCALVADALSELEGNQRAWRLLACLLICESTFVHVRPFYQMYRWSVPNKPSGLLTKRDIRFTVPWGWQLPLYYDGVASRLGQEAMQLAPHVHALWDRDYRGETWLEEGTGRAVIDERIPGKLVVHREQGEGPYRLVVNTNALAGWRVLSGKGRVEKNADGLLHVQGEGSAPIALRYFPLPSIAACVCYVLGMLGLAFSYPW